MEIIIFTCVAINNFSLFFFPIILCIHFEADSVDLWVHGCNLNCCSTLRGPNNIDPAKNHKINYQRTSKIIVVRNTENRTFI